MVVVPCCCSADVVCACSVDAGDVVEARRVRSSPGKVVLGGSEVSWTTVVLPGVSPPEVVCGADVSASGVAEAERTGAVVVGAGV